MTSQKRAPKIDRPIIPLLSSQSVVEKAMIMKIRVGIPSPAESQLFQRIVKKLSLVMMLPFVIVIVIEGLWNG